MIKVAVCGALGKMGREVVEAVKNCELTELSAKIDIAGDDTYKSIEEAMNLFLGENGFDKIFGSKRYLTMLDDLSEMLAPIMPLLKVNVDSIQNKIITKYKSHDEKVLKDE